MQSPTTWIVTKMEADTGTGKIATLLTGGIWSFSEIKRMGLTLDNAPSAYDSNGILKPCAVVRGRSSHPHPDLRDPIAKIQGEVAVVDIILLDDGDRGYATIDSALARLYALLEFNRGTGWHDCEWWGEQTYLRELELNDACKHICSWRITGTRS